MKLTRLKQLRKTSPKKGSKQSTDIKKQMCGYHIWITNAPKEYLPKESAREFYSLRWQIEIIFKIWKSILNIEKVTRMNIFRFECYLYGRFIAILLSGELFSYTQKLLYEQGSTDIELSE